MRTIVFGILLAGFMLISISSFSQNKRIRDYGIEIGVLKTGKNNAITDVEGVKVGHMTFVLSNNRGH